MELRADIKYCLLCFIFTTTFALFIAGNYSSPYLFFAGFITCISGIFLSYLIKAKYNNDYIIKKKVNIITVNSSNSISNSNNSHESSDSSESNKNKSNIAIDVADVDLYVNV